MSQDAYSAIGKVSFSWWASNIQADSGVAKKTRAQLRRASCPSDVLAIEATHQLHAQLQQLKLNADHNSDHYPLRLALMASVIAGIDEHARTPIPLGLGQSSGDKRALSELRFQRLLSASDDWELANRLRRCLPVLKRKANISITGIDLFYWGEKVRNRWCFQYFNSKLPDNLITESNAEHKEDN